MISIIVLVVIIVLLGGHYLKFWNLFGSEVTIVSDPTTGDSVDSSRSTDSTENVSGSNPGSALNMSFISTFDTDKDELISSSEFSTKGIESSTITSILEHDTDSDQKINSNEFMAYMSNRPMPTNLMIAKKVYLVTSDNQYVIKPGARRYSWVNINGDISQENLKNNGKAIAIVSESPMQYYLALDANSSGVINTLVILHGTKNMQSEKGHNVNFIGTRENGTPPLTILNGLDNTVHIYNSEKHATAPNIALEHSGNDFKHEFTSRQVWRGDDIVVEETQNIDELRKKIPNVFVHSLLKGPWKIIPVE